MTGRSKNIGLGAGAALVLCAGLALGPGVGARAQQQVNPIYVNDAPAATEAVGRALDLARSGNRDEAARVLQRVLDEDDGSVIATAEDPDTWIAVRTRVNNALLSDSALLESYRRQEQPTAQRMLEGGAGSIERSADAVERTRLLTSAGLEACLRVAQSRLEAGAFESARHALEQLEHHPDRADAAGKDCAELMTEVARYLGRPGVWSVAERWRRTGGLPPTEQTTVTPPESVRGATPLDVARGAFNLDDLVSRPLTSEKLTVDFAVQEAAAAPPSKTRPGDEPPAQARLLAVQPTVAGDTIYVNDGQSITALDRFTLEVRWRTLLGPLPAASRTQVMNQGSRALEDVCSVTVSDSWLVATTGLGMMGDRKGDGRVHTMDAQTGLRRWSVDVSGLAPELSEASVRGQAIIDQGVVIVSTLTRSRLKRLTSVHLVGLDLGTGRLVWHTPLASVGSLSYPQASQLTDGSAVQHGVLFTADRIGFACAVESATGRVRWLRRMRGEAMAAGSDSPWHKSVPQPAENVVYTMSPDRKSILALDALTGRTVAERSVSDFDRPEYLILAGEHLIVAGNRSVASLPVSELANADARPRVALKRPDLLGRVLVAGDRVMAATSSGLVSVPINARDSAATYKLDNPGVSLPLDGQLVVVDDSAIHTYLVWSRAERILKDRLLADTTDAAPGAALAELAHRAGKFDEVLPAVDAALKAIESQPSSPRNQTSRRRLFQSTMAMVDPDPAQAGAPPLPGEVAGPLLQRIARLANAPDERVRQLLALAGHEERMDRPARAVEALQAILDEPALASATVVRHGASFLAEAESTRRLQLAIQQHGRAVYARFDAEAEREHAFLASEADPDRFAALARRYPVSRSAARLWLSSATAYAQRSRRQASMFALEKGLRAAEDALTADDPVAGELAGRLVQELARDDRLAAAGATLSRVEERWPGVQLTENGHPLNLTSVRDSIAARLALLQRRPRIGTQISERASLLSGWTIARPMMAADSGPGAEFITLSNLSAGELGLYAADAGGGVRQLWSVPADHDTSVLRIDSRAVFLIRSGDRGPEITCYDLSSGRLMWKSPAFRDIFRQGDGPELRPAPDGAGPGGRGMVDTPLQSRRALTEVIATCDGATLVLVERTGRLAAIDLETGRPAWSRAESVPVVFDAAAAAGILSISGADPVQGGPRGQSRPRLLALDVRTGRTLHDLPIESGLIRWIRMTPDGALLAGLDQGVASFDLFQGGQRWMTTGAHTRLSLDAWVFPGRALVLNGRGLVCQLELDTGAITTETLDSTDRLGILDEVRAHTVGINAVFATRGGVGIYGRDGTLLGMDHRDTDAGLAPGEIGDECIVAIEDVPTSVDEQPPLYALNLFTIGSASLIERRLIGLGMTPKALALIDGRILITAGDATMVLDATRP